MNYPNLLSPITIGTKTYRNRVLSAPRGGVWHFDPDMIGTDPEQLADADRKCSGGVAVYCIGETPVSASACRGANEFYSFDDLSEEHTLSYRQYAEHIHQHGALAMVELCHMGCAKPEETPNDPAYGPMDCVNADGVHVRGMTKADIAATCADFAKAAKFMQFCGFDGVTIHCGHGWLPHQFLSPRWNQRQDEYGGSVENRARFTVELLQAVRQACGKDFVLECRVTGDEHLPDGYTHEVIQGYCKEISRYCDLIQVSAGVYNKPMETLMMSTLYDAHGCNVEAAAAIKAAVDIPVAVVGGINDPADAERWISEGKCDLVVLCRQLQADPEWVNKAAQGRACEIRKCLRCMRCYPGPFEEAMAELNGEFPEGCSVNPYLLHFDQWPLQKAEQAKKVLVIGGGVGGMQAAITAAERGHEVTLMEKSGQLGGILNFAKDDKDKYDLKALADAMTAEVASRKIDVRLNAQVTERDMQGYDQIICAVGSSPLTPPIPGLADCLPALKAYEPDTPIGQNVILLGGGLVGCETAVHLAKNGRKVTIVEMRDSLAPDAYRLHKHKLRQIIAADESIRVMTETKCLSISGGTVEVEQGGEKLTLTADTVVSALGMRANPTEELEAMAANVGVPMVKIGDCQKARKIFDAIEEGWQAAMNVG
jgi:2,4-dienoyl-CoA reductase-like NADH-dependent reductase (Old Yellow Enzyme family)/thioredoxin reductase